MIWLKCMAALSLLFWALPSCAFEFSYGTYFKISGIEKTEAGVVLPRVRKKYSNLKLLSSAMYRTLDTCQKECVQTVGEINFTVGDWRKAKTRDGMWIAIVEFDHQWAVTFLVFQNKKGFSVKVPDYFIFTDAKLEKDVKQALTKRAQEAL